MTASVIGNELVVPTAATFDLPWPMIEPQSANGTGVIASGELLFSGFSFRETTGAAPAIIDLFDGGGANGQLIATIALTPGQSVRDRLPWPGLHVEVGLFMNLVAGAVVGSAWAVLL